MTGRVVSIGECMVEFAPLPDGNYRQGFAGDTFNSAWYLRQLLPPAWAVDYVSRVGDDAMSGRMRAFMAEAGVGVDHVRPAAGEACGLYVIALADGERSFSYWRGQSAARSLADDPAALGRALDGARLALFSGISLAILPEAGREVLLQALATARTAGTEIAFDPNLRPRLWASVDEMRHWVDAAARVSDLALPSFDDDAAAFGDADPQATAQRYADLGAREIVVKNGGGPIHYKTTSGDGWVTPPPVPRIIDTTAAGDSFNAAYLAAKLAGLAIEERLARACHAAGRVIAAPGALVDLRDAPGPDDRA